LYAFYRGELFVGLTNVYSTTVVKKITKHPFAAGARICNIFYPKDDQLVVEKDRTFELYLNNGEAKVFVPCSFLSSVSELSELLRASVHRQH
jgi:hypothetical protein